MGGPSTPSQDILYSPSTASFTDLPQMPSVSVAPQLTPPSVLGGGNKFNFGDVIKGTGSALSGVNTGLSLYRAFQGDKTRSSDLTTSGGKSAYIPPAVGGNSGAGGRGGMPQGNFNVQMPKVQQVQSQASGPSSSHFDILRQLLGVYQG